MIGTPAQPLRVGILGAGMIATHHYGVLPNLQPIADRIDIRAIASQHLEKAEAVARRFGIPLVFDSLEAMLDRAEIDAVVNLTPISVHGSSSARILEAGKHLVTEKPLATNMDQADAIIELATRKDLVVVCAPPNMLFPSRIETRRLIQRGSIGKVAFARVRSSHAGPAAYAWPVDPTSIYQRGAGSLYDMGVYGITEITGILGPAKRVIAFAGIANPVRTVRGGPFDGLEIEVTADDNVILMLDFGESTFAVVDCTFNVTATKSPQIELFGTEGAISLGETDVEVFASSAIPGFGGWVQPTSTDYQSRLHQLARLQRAVLIEHLVRCLANASEPVLSAAHARHVLEIMIKANESAKTTRVATLQTTFAPVDTTDISSAGASSLY